MLLFCFFYGVLVLSFLSYFKNIPVAILVITDKKLLLGSSMNLNARSSLVFRLRKWFFHLVLINCLIKSFLLFIRFPVTSIIIIRITLRLLRRITWRLLLRIVIEVWLTKIGFFIVFSIWTILRL